MESDGRGQFACKWLSMRLEKANAFWRKLRILRHFTVSPINSWNLPHCATNFCQNYKTNYRPPASMFAGKLFSAIFVFLQNINWYKRMGTTKDVIKLNDYLTTKSVNYEFIRAWQIWKTSNIAALIIDVI